MHNEVVTDKKGTMYNYIITWKKDNFKEYSEPQQAAVLLLRYEALLFKL